MKNIFVDSDVILDVLIPKIDYVVDSAIVLDMINKKKDLGFTSSVIILNVYYIIKKSYNREEAINIIKKTMNLLKILNVSDVELRNAFNSTFPDIEDAVQYQVAINNKIDYIITRNKKDYTNSIIPIYTPTEYINQSL